MSGAARRTMPLGLLTSVLARLWLVHMRLRIARLLVWFVQNAAALMGAISMTTRAAFGPPFLFPKVAPSRSRNRC